MSLIPFNNTYCHFVSLLYALKISIIYAKHDTYLLQFADKLQTKDD